MSLCNIAKTVLAGEQYCRRVTLPQVTLGVSFRPFRVVLRPKSSVADSLHVMKVFVGYFFLNICCFLRMH